MNALTNPTWQNFRTTVLPIFPRATGEELELRSRLLLIRDLAIRALGYASEEAYPLLQAISQMAGKYALAEISVDQLREMRRILVMSSAAANSMQVLINGIHHSWAEGKNARG